MPRTNRSMGTPAWDASTSLSMTSLSVMEFVLKNSPHFSPRRARSICTSMLRRMFCLIMSGATHRMS